MQINICNIETFSGYATQPARSKTRNFRQGPVRFGLVWSGLFVTSQTFLENSMDPCCILRPIWLSKFSVDPQSFNCLIDISATFCLPLTLGLPSSRSVEILVVPRWGLNSKLTHKKNHYFFEIL